MAFSGSPTLWLRFLGLCLDWRAGCGDSGDGMLTDGGSLSTAGRSVGRKSTAGSG